MSYPEKFKGYFINDHKKWSDFKLQEFEPKKFNDYDVDIEIQACGICSSDLHTLTGGWAEAKLPVCAGHEIVGKVLKVGPKVTLHKPGDRVGVGAQVFSCRHCKQCKSDNENYCPSQVDTYNAEMPDGYITKGGYASHVRVHEYWVFSVPEKLETNVVAPMLCAGATVFGPLHRYGAGPGKNVGVVGIGGLGHLAIQFAKALGADVYGLTHTGSKVDDIKELGAKPIVTGKEGWDKDYQLFFDLIINTADAAFDISPYLSCLNVNCRLVNVGLADQPLPEISAMAFMSSGAFLGGSHIASRPEIEKMLKLAAEHNVKTWIEPIPIGEKGLHEALTRLGKNDVRYRFVMTDFDKAFK